MKIFAGVALAALSLPVPALAANTLVTTQPGQSGAPAGSTVLTFNSVDPVAEAAAKGISLISGGFSGQFSGTTTANGFTFAAPSPQDGGFYGVGGTASGQTVPQSFARFTGAASQGFSAISVFLGSLDAYNVVKLYYSDGGFDTYDGQQLNNGVAPGFPGGAINTRATFTATNGKTYSGVEFYNNGTSGSLEFDNLSFSSAVPEPATWAMMLIGFGMIGAAARRRRRDTAVRYA